MEGACHVDPVRGSRVSVQAHQASKLRGGVFSCVPVWSVVHDEETRLLRNLPGIMDLRPEQDDVDPVATVEQSFGKPEHRPLGAASAEISNNQGNVHGLLEAADHGQRQGGVASAVEPCALPVHRESGPAPARGATAPKAGAGGCSVSHLSRGCRRA